MVMKKQDIIKDLKYFKTQKNLLLLVIMIFLKVQVLKKLRYKIIDYQFEELLKISIQTFTMAQDCINRLLDQKTAKQNELTHLKLVLLLYLGFCW